MPLIEWKKEYEVRIPRIDREHQGLVDIINRLHEAMLERKAREVVSPVVDDLVSYTRVHFRNEEAMLRAKSYPGLELHQVEHAYFTDKVTALQADCRAGKLVMGSDIVAFLRDWLLQHILKTDTQFVDYLADRGML